jgi:nicotinamidase/pyrazinamidase
MVLDFPFSTLIIIDVQNDFCPGGALAVKGGDEAIEPLNRLSALFAANGGRVIATQDWHPAGHVSFRTNTEAGLWPPHCVQGTAGADFHVSLDLKPVNVIVRKGFRPGLDSYSAFFENDRKTPTGLDGFLKALSIDTLVLGGLATDYCVLYSALDAAALGYKTTVLTDAVRAVDIPAGSAEQAFKTLTEAGVTLAASYGFAIQNS